MQAHLSSTNTKANNNQQKNICKQTNQQNTKEVQNNTPTEDHNSNFQASNCLSSEHSYAKKFNRSTDKKPKVIKTGHSSRKRHSKENSSSISTNKKSKHASSISEREKKLRNLCRKYGIKYEMPEKNESYQRQRSRRNLTDK